VNEVNGRLSALNPVPDGDVPGAAASADAADLLQRILSQPVTSPAAQRPTLRPGRRAKAGIAAAAAIAVAAGIGVSVDLAGRTSPHPVSSSPPVLGFRPGPSQGLATSAARLVDYAARAAALAPAFVPGPREWMYRDLLETGGPFGSRRVREVTWLQIGTDRAASLDHGKLSHGVGPGGPRGAQVKGWPGTWSNLYRYLAALPARPAALRHVVLANNHSRPAAAFRAIMALMTDFPLPPRFQAELYAVLAGLPGMRFDPSATDAAGRHGIGLYIIQDGFLKQEIIINPRTYTYMGMLWVVVKTHNKYGRHLRKGSIQGWTAILGTGIVQRAGQLP
jgi:hypothetical protein